MSQPPTNIRALDWIGDPVVLVYAVRGALDSRGSHAPEAIRQAITMNRAQIPAVALTAMARDIGDWLNGPGNLRPVGERAPWVQALAVLTSRPRLASNTGSPTAGGRR